MISEAELRHAAAVWRIDPMIVDLDYVLGCFLSQWSLEPTASRMRFKGGSCLRKCYFVEYRFSEDLDFTAEQEPDTQMADRLVQRLIQRVGDAFGIDLAAAPPLLRRMTEDDEEACLEARLYYRGPLRRTGAPRGLRLHISAQEHLAFPAAVRPLHHPYDDSHLVQPARVLCYDLREVLAEKLRAISGQRRHAISRDLYDLHWLLTQGGLSLECRRVSVGSEVHREEAKYRLHRSCSIQLKEGGIPARLVSEPKSPRPITQPSDLRGRLEDSLSGGRTRRVLGLATSPF